MSDLASDCAMVTRRTKRLQLEVETLKEESSSFNAIATVNDAKLLLSPGPEDTEEGKPNYLLNPVPNTYHNPIPSH
jgi:anthranilate/para-aminobenzoate synthase component II